MIKRSPLQRASILIETTSPKIINNIVSTKKSVRDRAISLLKSKLNLENPYDLDTFKKIPLSFISDWDLDIALSFLATVISNWFYIETTIINEVYKKVLAEIEIESELWNQEYLAYIDKQITFLLSKMKASWLYQNDINLNYLFWNEYQRKWKIKNAISQYQILIDNWEPQGYILLWNAYKISWKISDAIETFKIWWQYYQDPIFLENIIKTFCEIWNFSEAKKFYQTYKTQYKEEQKVIPFILFSHTIENDFDLNTFKDLTLSLIFSTNFSHKDYIKLSISARNYINNEIIKIEHKLSQLNNLDSDEKQAKDYNKLIYRRLYLMSFHINYLKDTSYLYIHLNDINNLLNLWWEAHILLENFFDNEIFPIEIEKDEENIWVSGEIDEPISEIIPWIHYDIYRYMLNFLWFLLRWKEEQTLNNIFWPLLTIAHEKSHIFENNDILELENLINWNNNLYNFLSKFQKKVYHDYISYIDNKYWKYLSWYIQNEWRKPLIFSQEIPKIINLQPELAILYFIEKIICCDFGFFLENSTFSNFCEKYDFPKLNETATLSFLVILFNFSKDLTIDFIINSDFLMQNIFSIYYLLESLNSLEKEEAQKLIIKINEYLDHETFFNYLDNFLNEKLSSKNLTDLEKEYCLLSYAIFTKLNTQNSDITKNMLIETEKSYYSAVAWTKVANILEEDWDLDEAIKKYEMLFLATPNMDILKKIIFWYIKLSNFNKAHVFINLWISFNYEMSQYFLYYYLSKNDLQNAFNTFINISNKNFDIIDEPLWILDILKSKAEECLNISNSNNYKEMKLKYFAINILFLLWKDFQDNISTNKIYNTLAEVLDILSHIDIWELKDFVNDTFFITHWKDFLDYSWEISEAHTFDDALYMINNYAIYMNQIFLKNVWLKKWETLKDFSTRTNNFILLIISFLQKFSESKNIITLWQNQLTLVNNWKFFHSSHTLFTI